MFSENGFEGTSVAAFNRELGVSHNLIHQRFGSKEALWYVTGDWAFGQIADQLADVDGLAAPDPVEAMRVMVHRLLEVHSRHPHMSRLVTMEAATANPRLTYSYEAHVVPLPLACWPRSRRWSTAACSPRCLHFVIAPRSGRAVQHGALRQDAQPRWTPWTPTPCASMRAWSPT